MDYKQLNTLIKLGRDFGHEQIRDTGFTDTEHGICTFLCFHDRVSQDYIATALLFDKTTVAKALSSMEGKGLIAREQNPANRRENCIHLSDAGRASVSGSVDLYDTWLKRACACLSAEEQLQLDGYFDRIVQNAIRLHEADKKSNTGKDR